MIGFWSCDCVVGPDGGAMHVAAGLDIPTLTLFGDVDPNIWNPYSKKSFFIKSPSDTLLDLTPCMVAERTLSLISSLPGIA
jgi:ADP-heptose:LPS heptosyltransferase